MIRNLVNLSIIGTIIGVGAVGLGAGAIVMGCHRHKVARKLRWAEIVLALDDIEICLKDAEIKRLKEEIQNLKFNCQETKES